ncbi:MAG TPA: SRPBCC family protein [Propionibacteriaceae bacterium]|nr:SRPBCC family protein [Propionibacteriaceae bacterium]
MIIDLAKQIGAISREVSRQHTESGETVAVTLQRRYPADQADVWQAITDPDRVRRWFLPLTGDLREGGSFQLEGHAGGDIVTCEPPRHLIVTFGGETSIVDVVLSADDQQTLLKLTHSVPIELAGSGAGALYVGPGWDGALLGIALYLAGEVIDDPVAAANSSEMQDFNLSSIKEWVATIEASGTADADAIAAAQQASLAQFAPDLVRPD